jgi:hypothetical protein
VSFDLGKRRARRQAELFGEDVKDAGETNERGVFSDGPGGKITEVNLTLCGRHHWQDLTT